MMIDIESVHFIIAKKIFYFGLLMAPFFFILVDVYGPFIAILIFATACWLFSKTMGFEL